MGGAVKYVRLTLSGLESWTTPGNCIYVANERPYGGHNLVCACGRQKWDDACSGLSDVYVSEFEEILPVT